MIRVGLIGHPVAHSKSPQMHGAAFGHAGIVGRYDAVDVPPGDLEAFLRRACQEGWRGFNVTIPHKQRVFDHLKGRLSPLAEAVGAVNTVVRSADGALFGTNTDVGGFLAPLPDLATDRPALVLGAGGAARAVVAGLASLGLKTIWVSARRLRSAQDLTRCRAAEPLPYTRAALRGLWPQLVVNTTPVGLGAAPETLAPFFDPLPWESWPPLLAYDLIYAPRLTAFMVAAKRAGHATLNGLPMLIHQGALAFEAWTGVPSGRIIGAMGRAIGQ